MGILNKKQNKERGVMVGTYLKEVDASFLNLFCVATHTTKAAILNEFLENKLAQCRSEFSTKELITKIVIIGREALAKNKKPLGDFYTELNDELIKKGIEESIVDEIIQKLKNGSKEKNRRRK